MKLHIPVYGSNDRSSLDRRSNAQSPTPSQRFFLLVFAFLLSSHSAASRCFSADLAKCQKLLDSGKYRKCIEYTTKAIKENEWGESWYELKAKAELTLGEYAEAEKTVELGLVHYPSSIRLRYQGIRSSRYTGNLKQSEKSLQEIDSLAERSPWSYTSSNDLVILGKAALLLHADPKHVLKNYFSRAKIQSPKVRAPYLAIAELALNKGDPDFAAEILTEAEKKFPDDAEIAFSLGRALVESHHNLATQKFALALEKNPNHIASYLYRVDRLINAEQHRICEDLLKKVLAINPHHPQAWAYRAVIAHLESKPQIEKEDRQRALAHWKTNPEVDHLIGKKLSQQYRFAEGAAHQRQALKFDASYLPAKIQLMQDLLRLGREEEAWQLADETHKNDGYDLTTFNLLELHQVLTRFRTLENEHFLLRMEAREAAIYGEEALDLLTNAKLTLCKKYGLKLKQKIVVEIFPDDSDFEVRTFGMPGITGYLGVCFGKVITSKSPAASLENPTNWKSVLWHEFCHVVTLNLTKNKMPRWLSEGISVYEEEQKNHAWGQDMNPRYREMILNGEFMPLGQLSSAFISPKSRFHLQFAYYQSYLAVEFLVTQFGMESLKHVLGDLGLGIPINIAISRRTLPIEELEPKFRRFLVEKANALAPQADWSKVDLKVLQHDDVNTFEEWILNHPNHFRGVMLLAGKLFKDEQWEKAIAPLKKAIELYPNNIGIDNAYTMLAEVYRKLHRDEDETKVLERFIQFDASSVKAHRRLLELYSRKKTNSKMLRFWNLTELKKQIVASRLLAINPFLPDAYTQLANAAESNHDLETAIRASKSLLALNPPDLAEAHYRLAVLLRKKNDPTAKRHVLQALEEAPRYRAAYRLLLELTKH